MGRSLFRRYLPFALTLPLAAWVLSCGDRDHDDGPAPLVVLAVHVPYSTGGPKPFGITHPAADLNGDGHIDLAVTHQDGTIGVLMNDGKGGFPSAVAYPLVTATDLAPYPAPAASVGRGIVAADVNGDGFRDLIAADAGKAQHSGTPGDVPGWVVVYLNNGVGVFTRMPPMAVGSRPLGFALAHLDGDALVDVVIDIEDVDGIQALGNNGDGTFTIRQTIAPILNSLSTHFPLAGDFTGDGRADILVPGNENESITLLVGAGDGTFLLNDMSRYAETLTGSVTIPLPAPFDAGPVANPTSRIDLILFELAQPKLARPHHLASADFNRDGRLDFAIANTGPSGALPRISVFMNTGTGFAEQASSAYFATNTSRATTAFVYTGDFAGPNGLAPDGLPDIVAQSGGSSLDNHLVLLVNQGPPGYIMAKAEGSPYFIGTVLTRMFATGDFNGDGKADLAVTEDAAAGRIWLLLHK